MDGSIPTAPTAPTTIPTTMRAWVASAAHPGVIECAELPVPVPEVDEVLVRVRACGVCRTDLHVRDGELPSHREQVVPGHEAVGEVVAGGARVAGPPTVGARVGIPWLRRTCGVCRYCARGQENLCPSSLYTGWDAHGGYAPYATVPAAYAYDLPGGYPDEELAPLLCAGIIGYRALRRAALPPGGCRGIWGFGGSAHLAAQVAMAEGATVHVFTRAATVRALALDLGAASASDSFDPAPEPLDSAIVFAPAGELVPAALELLDRGGIGDRRDPPVGRAGPRLLGPPVPGRQVRSVTANTRADGEEFLRLADRLPLQVATTPYDLSDADRALADLAADRVNGAAVLLPE